MNENKPEREEQKNRAPKRRTHQQRHTSRLGHAEPDMTDGSLGNRHPGFRFLGRRLTTASMLIITILIPLVVITQWANQANCSPRRKLAGVPAGSIDGSGEGRITSRIERQANHHHHNRALTIETGSQPEIIDSGENDSRNSNAFGISSSSENREEAGLSSSESMRVAAFASKLEQWLLCRRLQGDLAGVDSGGGSREDSNSATASDSTSASASASNTRTSPDELAGSRGVEETRGGEASLHYCPAHYDGHLCWPATRVGKSIELPCPQLATNYLVGLAPAPSSSANESVSGSEPTSESNQVPTSPSTTISTHPLIMAYSNDNLNANNMNQNNKSHNNQMNAISRRDALFSASDTEPPTQSGNLNGGQEAAINQKRIALARRSCLLLRSASQASDSRSTQGVGPGPPETRATQKLLELFAAEAPTTTTGGQWESEPNYMQCKHATGAETTSNNEKKEDDSLTSFDPTDDWVKLETSDSDRRLFGLLVGELNRIESNIDPYGDPDLLDQWTMCIGKIMRWEAAKVGSSKSSFVSPQPSSSSQMAGKENSKPFCPIIFDGWRCWPATEAGQTAFVGCPSTLPGFIAERKAHKICTENGTWYRHPKTNRYWSNYTTCVDIADLAFRTKILNLYVIGNTISLVALSVSLIIFMNFKSLKCTRVTIHKNLFLSFITNNLMWIIWYLYIVNDADILRANPIECRLWHIVLHYFLVSNYFWMFCEGLYLHTLLVVAFVSEDRILKWFYILGWLIPLPITIAYAYNRHRSRDPFFTRFCWMEENSYNLILMVPIGISLLLNLIFLINIVRVLVTKLRANNTPDAHQTRKAVRATLFLIPLLGLHYILTPFRPEAKSEWESIYEIITAVCTSFQGLCVAMLFCFCNGEVSTLIRKKLNDTCSTWKCRLFSRFDKKKSRNNMNHHKDNHNNQPVNALNLINGR